MNLSFDPIELNRLIAEQVREQLRTLVPEALAAMRSNSNPVKQTWRERIWEAPPETRLDPREAAEALGLSRATVYRKCEATDDDRLPHRKLRTGGIEFVAAELRSWIAQRAIVAHPGTIESVAVQPIRERRWRRE
jgi:predicted DNA-binding transcriptional regulator AlpA